MKTRLGCLTTLAALGLLLFVTGCKSTSVSHYISPRVTGRVVDAQSREPIKGVKVQRVMPDQVVNMDGPPKAGQVMQSEHGTTTAADGSFILDSKRDVELFADVGWDSVTISFSHSGYATFVAVYPATNAVASPDGEPVVNAGSISLKRLSH